MGVALDNAAVCAHVCHRSWGLVVKDCTGKVVVRLKEGQNTTSFHTISFMIMLRATHLRTAGGSRLFGGSPMRRRGHIEAAGGTGCHHDADER